MPTITYHIRGLLRAAGLAKTSEILFRRAFGVPGVVSVNVQGHKLEVRPADSDLFILSQIFGWKEYNIDSDRLARLRKVASDWQATGIEPLIIDAGANVGYSSLYFAGLFPGACVLAIEPAPPVSRYWLAKYGRAQILSPSTRLCGRMIGG
jgi:hypothetical protein